MRFATGKYSVPPTTSGEAVLKPFIWYDHLRASWPTLLLLISSRGEKRVAARSRLIVRQSPAGIASCARPATGAAKANNAATPRRRAPRIPIPSFVSDIAQLGAGSIDFVLFRQDRRL